MSNARPAFPAAGIRSRAFALIRQCWKPLLIAALITGLFAWCSSALTMWGEQLGTVASKAALTDFYADAPAEGTSEYIEWLYFNEYALEDAAEKAAARASLPWRAAATGVDLLGWVVGTFVMLGLYRGLLSALRGGQCTVSVLLGGRRGYRRALWTDVVMFLRMVGYILLIALASGLLTFSLRNLGAIIALIALVICAIWLTLRYMLAELHVAEDAEGAFSASDYIRQSVEDVRFFTFGRVIGVLWPFWLAGLAFALPSILAESLPVMATVSVVTDLGFAVLTGVVGPALMACIYEAIRDELNAPDPRKSDGAQRAKALSAGEDSEA